MNDVKAVKAEIRRMLEGGAFRVEVRGRDLILVPLPEPTDYVDVTIARTTWLSSISNPEGSKGEGE